MLRRGSGKRVKSASFAKGCPPIWTAWTFYLSITIRVSHTVPFNLLDQSIVNHFVSPNISLQTLDVERQ